MSKPSLEEMIKFLISRRNAIPQERMARWLTLEEATAESEMLESIEEAIVELSEIYESMNRHMVKRGYVQE